MGVLIRRLIMSIGVIGVSIYALFTISQQSLSRDTQYNDCIDFTEVYSEYLTDNTYIVQREAINNILYNMNQDGFSMTKDSNTDTYRDLVFTKGSVKWRFLYEYNTNYLMFFKNTYEDSYEGITYTIERIKCKDVVRDS